MIHGRRYQLFHNRLMFLRFHGIEHNPYPLPNDEEEFGRLKNLHNALRDILDGNVLAPITPGATNILDVGCGSGHWCIEVANQFPSAAVKGIDLSPIQPELVPLNVDFIVADLNEGLYFDEGSHDLVHSRYDIAI
jgi:metalloendopeptidase OMA1, mitochondrial